MKKILLCYGIYKNFYCVRQIQGGIIMLVLGRKPGEYVVIGDNIKIKVVKSLSGDLRLAIEAPKEIAIIRGEVWEKEEGRSR
jgi:carbon storage regulator